MTMSVFAIIILAALLAEFLLNTVASLLNLRALAVALPPSLEGMYDPGDYRRSQEYTRATARFGLLTSAVRLALLLGFWFSGGFNYLDQAVWAWGYHPIVNGLLYIGILLVAYELVMMPFGAYATFVIEGRFGFNRTTARVFIMDRLKGLLLAAVLGMPLLAAILALFQHGGALAWVYCWIASAAFSLGVQFVAPIWILPLFNKFRPMESGQLKDALLKYADSVGYAISKVFVIDGSRRSSKSNAFFTGFGRNKRIALFDTLIARHTVPELVAVLAHEIGHYRKGHVLQGALIGILHAGILLFLLSMLLGNPALYRAFYVEQQSVYTGLLFFGFLYTPVEVLLSVVLQMLSRRNEYAADRYAAETTGEPQHLAQALKRLSSGNLSNLTPHPFYVFLNYSHPPLRERLRAIEQYAQSSAGARSLPV